MAAPQAPLPTKAQITEATAVTVSVQLRGLGPAPAFAAGTTFNSGAPTATYTLAAQQKAFGPLCDLLDEMVADGRATVA